MDDEKEKKDEKNQGLDKKAPRRRWSKEDIPNAMTQVLILPRLLQGTSDKDSVRIEDVLQTIKEVWVEKNSVQRLEEVARGASGEGVGAASAARRLSVPEAVIRRHALRRQRSDSEDDSAATAPFSSPDGAPVRSVTATLAAAAAATASERCGLMAALRCVSAAAAAAAAPGPAPLVVALSHLHVDVFNSFIHRFKWPPHTTSSQDVQSNVRADKMCVGQLPIVVGRKDIHEPIVGFVSSVHEKNLRFVTESSPSCRQLGLNLEEEEGCVQSDAELWSRNSEPHPVTDDLGKANRTPDVLSTQLNSDPRYKQFERECLGIVAFLRKCMQTLGSPSEREHQRAALTASQLPPVTSSSEKSFFFSEAGNQCTNQKSCVIPPLENKNTFPFVLSRSDMSSGNYGHSGISSIPWKSSKGFDYEVIKSDHSSNSECLFDGDRASESCSVTPVSVSSETSASWPSFEDSKLTPLELLESCDEDRDMNSGRTNVPSSQGSFPKDVLAVRKQKRTERFSSSPEMLVINDSSVKFPKSNSEREIVKKFVPVFSPDRASIVCDPVDFSRANKDAIRGDIFTLRNEKRERNNCIRNYNSENKNQTLNFNISQFSQAGVDEKPGRRNDFNIDLNYTQSNGSIPPFLQRNQCAMERDVVSRSDGDPFTANTGRSQLLSCASDTNFDILTLEDTVSSQSKLSNTSALNNMPLTSFMGSGTTYVELPYPTALSVPRFSAVPRSVSMLVNVSSENSSSDSISDSGSGSSSSSFENEGLRQEDKNENKYCTIGRSANNECLRNDFQFYRSQYREDKLEEIHGVKKFRTNVHSNILQVESTSFADENNKSTAYPQEGKLPVIGNRLQNISDRSFTSPTDVANRGPKEFSILQMRNKLPNGSKNANVEDISTLSNTSDTYTIPRCRKEHLTTDETHNTIRNDFLTNNTSANENGIQNRFSMAPSTAILMRKAEVQNFSQATGNAIDKYGSLVLPQISATRRVPVRSLRSPVRTLYSNGNIIRIPEHAFMPNYPPDFRIKFKKPFEAIPEERSISLESSMEGADNVGNPAANATETKNHTSPIEEANEVEDNDSRSNTPTGPKENKPESGADLTTNDKQINTTPSLRGENSDSSSNVPGIDAKLCVSVGTNTSEKDFMVSKGKAALAMENESDLVSQSKGWINFYMIKDAADATENPENNEESGGSGEHVKGTVTVVGGDKRLRRQSAREVSCQMCSENSSGRSSSAAAAPESRRMCVAACEAAPYEESWVVRSECCDLHLAGVLHRSEAFPLRLIPLHPARRHSLLLRGGTPALRGPALRDKAFRLKEQEPQRSRPPRSGLPEIRPHAAQRRNTKQGKDSGLPPFGRNKDADSKDSKYGGEFHTLSSSSRCVHGEGGGQRCIVEDGAAQCVHLTVTGCAIAPRAARPFPMDPLPPPPRRRGRSAAPFAPANH